MTDSSPPPLPNFLIIGAMRSGTTSLTHHLREHPAVFLAPGKELHFFDWNFERGVDWYRSHFAEVQRETAIGEATPLYLYEPEAIPRMFEVVPTAKLIAVLRDPVERAYSHYWHTRAKGNEPLEFAEAIEAEAARLKDPANRASYSYLDRGRYSEQLQHVCRFFSREALRVLLFEDLRDSPLPTFRSLCRFLGVDDGLVPSTLDQPFNTFVQFRSPRLRNLMLRAPAPLRHALGRLNTRRGAEYPAMEPGLRKRLDEHYAEERVTLTQFLNRDLSEWGDEQAG